MDRRRGKGEDMEIKRKKKIEADRKHRAMVKQKLNFLSTFYEKHKHLEGVIRDLHVTKTVLGKGNGSVVLEGELTRGNGTVVLEGELTGGVKVAVKRVSNHLNEMIKREVKNLLVLKQHKNILQYYGTSEHDPLTDIILELCTCNLKALIDVLCGRPDDKIPNLNSITEMSQGIRFWKEGNAHVSTDLVNFLQGIVDGIHYLHKKRIIHRDIKPQNILINKVEIDGSLCPKIADMGISKCLPEDRSSFTCSSHGLLAGTFSWTAPEVLKGERLTKAADIFSMGCVLFFCITQGKHPFDDKECEENSQQQVQQDKHLFDLDRVRGENIMKYQLDLSSIEGQPEAHHLIQHLLEKDPKKRPNTDQISKHPFFWTAKRILDFLKAAGDRVSKAVKNNEIALVSAVEGCLDLTKDPWDKELDQGFVQHMFNFNHGNAPHYITTTKKKKNPNYNNRKVKDLLRFIRNGLTHFDVLPPTVQAALENSAEALAMYFSSKFPGLLFNVYQVLLYNNFNADVVIDEYKWL